MSFLREDARAMHEGGAGKGTIADMRGEENMATAGAAVRFAFRSAGKTRRSVSHLHSTRALHHVTAVAIAKLPGCKRELS